MLRESLAVLLALLLAHPAWGNVNIVGNVASSQYASIRGAAITPGSTVFTGDTLEVGEHGTARIALAGGAQVLLEGDSLVRLTRAEKKVQVAIERGRTTFRSTAEAPVEALLGDATVRPANNAPAAGVIFVRNEQSAFIAAERGALEIHTAHDGRSVNLREGEGVEVMLATAKPAAASNSTGVAGHSGMTVGKIVILGAILACAATAIGLGLGRREATQNNVCLEVSPFKVNC